MQKRVKKIIKFLIILLIITICALVVNKTTDMKIFGSKEAQANANIIHIPESKYTIEVGEEFEIPYTLDTSTVPPDQVDNYSIFLYSLDYTDHVSILDPTTGLIEGIEPGEETLGFGYIDNEFHDFDPDAPVATVTIEVVPASTGTTVDMGLYTVSSATDFTQDDDSTISINAQVDDVITLHIGINDVDDDGYILADYSAIMDSIVCTVTPEITMGEPVRGIQTYDITITCQVEAEGAIYFVYGIGDEFEFDDANMVCINLSIQDGNEKIYSTDVTTSTDSYEVPLNDTITINASLYPDTVTVIPSNLEWDIDDNTVVELKSRTYDARNKVFKGTFQGKKPGTTTITITDPESGVYTEVEIEVTTDPVSTITMDTSYQATSLNEFYLVATVGEGGIDESTLPDDLVWTVGDNTVLSITDDNNERNGLDYYGHFTPLKAGTTTVTATYPEDTTITATCTVTIVEEIDVTAVVLSQDSADLKIGDSIVLNATIEPSNATNKPTTLLWTIGNQNIISEDSSTTSNSFSKKFNALAEGTTTITVSTPYGDFSDSITISVTRQAIETLAMDKTTLSLPMSSDGLLYVTWTPSPITPAPTIEFTNSDSTVASYNVSDSDSIGCIVEVTPLKPGRTTLTAISGEVSTSCEIVVVAPELEIQSISLDKQTASLEVGEGIQLTVSVSPENATALPNEFIWTLSNDKMERFLTGLETGELEYSAVFTALEEGETTITATVPNTSISASCVVTITDSAIEIESISLDKTTASLEVGDGLNLTVSVTPNNATELPDYFEWDISDMDVIDFVYTGLDPDELVYTKAFTALKAGEATITATVPGTDISASCVVTITDSAIEIESISLDKTTASLEVGDGLNLTVSVTPNNATELPDYFEWDISDMDVIDFVYTGLDPDELVYTKAFTALEAGEATITATVPGTDITASCVVTVTNPVVEIESISLDKTTATVEAGDGLNLTVSVTPNNATELPDYFEWDISDMDVIDFVYTGLDPDELVYTKAFTALEAGEATITATVPGTDITASCVVTVIEPEREIETVSIDKSAITTRMGSEETVTVTWSPSLLYSTPGVFVVTEADKLAYEITSCDKEKCELKLTPQSVGTTTLSVTVNGKSTTCDITILPPIIEIEAISLDKEAASLVVGDRVQLTAIIEPDNATELPDQFTWTISNSNMSRIAIGEDTGELNYTETFIADAAGTTTITVAVPGTDISASCVVSISDEPIPIESISLDKTTATIEEGEQLELSLSISPSDATEIPSVFEWTYSNEKLEKLSESTNGVVRIATFKGLEPGETTITVTVPGTDISASCEVTITEHVDVVEAVSINKTTLPIEMGSSGTLTISWTPAPLKEIPDVDISFSEDEIVTYEEESCDKSSCVITITPEQIGRTVLTATVLGESATCEIVVVAPTVDIESISLDKEAETIKVGEGIQLTVSISPSNATELPSRFVWTISNSKMERILIGQDTDELEYVASFKALEEGTTTITVKTQDGRFSDSCVVTIEPEDSSDELEVDFINDEFVELLDEGTNYISTEEVSTLEDLQSSIETNGTIKVYIAGELVTDPDTKLPTGAVIEIEKGNQKVTFVLVVEGDLNGDAEVDDIDLLMMARYNTGFDAEVELVKGPYLKATNLVKDDNFGDDSDVLRLSRRLVGLD